MLGRIFLFGALALALYPFLRGAPSEAKLRYRLGEGHMAFESLGLRYFHDDEEVAGAHFTFPGGAPATFDHIVSLPSGEIRVQLSLSGDEGERSRTHRFQAPVDGTLVLSP